ncbi:MAG: ABC transporter ATP-binding protein [Bacteroidales bacterium]|nr:ABC transporter ATP-binding protein [Bacteroidales bacterium]
MSENTIKENTTILEVRNLSIAFKQEKAWKEVIHSVNFSLKKGEILSLVGESGSGKSVSSLAIMGLLDKKIAKITQGEIVLRLDNNSVEFDSKKIELDSTSAKQRDKKLESSFRKLKQRDRKLKQSFVNAESHSIENEKKEIHLGKLTEKEFQQIRGKNIAMIFQEPMTALNPVKKCGCQVDEMILTHKKHLSKKQAKERTIQLFNEVLLPDAERVYNSYPFELSGGQRQRVMIAMAISCEPEILIADEPTTALDVTVQKTILSLITSLQKKHNMSVLFISHDLGVVKGISNRAAVIYKGSIVEQDSIENIFSSPKQAYTKGLIASRPPVNYKPTRLLTVSDFLSEKKIEIHNITETETKESRAKIYTQEPILQVNNLNIDYSLKKNFFGKTTKTFHAVKNASFDVYMGETLGLVGESGCGKTTIGRAIMQLVDNASGNIIFKGKKLDDLSSKEKLEIRKKIQIVFQDPYSSLNPRKTIGYMIEEPMEVHHISNAKERREKTINILNQVGLSEEFYNRYPHELSGGQRQRIGIARALCLNPELIICDESVSALDVSVQAQVLNLLNELKENHGFTYIFISHDLRVVKYMSDRILVMKNGEIVESNFAEQVYEHPQQDYTKKLLSSVFDA